MKRFFSERSVIEKMAWAFGLLCLLLLALSPGRYIYDEIYYYLYPVKLIESGFNSQFVHDLHAPPGPLNALAHSIFYPLWEVNPIGMRFATFAMFLSAGLVLGRLTKALAPQWSCPAMACLMAIPFGGVTYLLALTEIPAMLCLVAGLTLLFSTFPSTREASTQPDATPPPGESIRWLYAIGSGVLLGLSVWGRQNYLMVGVALLIWFTMQNAKWKTAPRFTIVLGIFAVMSGWLFWVWGGLVPPAVAHVAETSRAQPGALTIAGLNFNFGLRAFGYTGVIFLLLFPRYFNWSVKAIGAVALVSLTLVLLFPELRFLPSRYVIEALLSPELAEYAAVLMGSSFAFLGLFLIWSTLVQLWNRRNEAVFWFFTSAWACIVASNVKVGHQFSSRYVFVAVPFILLSGFLTTKPGKWLPARLAVGMLVSVALVLKNQYF